MKKQTTYIIDSVSANTSKQSSNPFSSFTAGAGETPSTPAGAGVIMGSSPDADNCDVKERLEDDTLEDFDEAAVCELRIFETAIDFARRWGVEQVKLEGRKAFFPVSESRWNVMRNLPSDELAALMRKWAKEHLATTEQEPMNDFFSMKLAELFKKEGL